MAQAERARIAFVGPRSANSTHYRSFKEIIPTDVQIDFYGLELAGQSLFDLRGKKDTIIQRAAELAEKHRWQAAVFSGAPVEVLNPGFFAALRERFKFPVTTALDACVAALEAYGARKLLLITPFDEPMNRLIREHLERAQIHTVSPARSLTHYTDALKMSPEEVYRLAEAAVSEAGDIEGIYFQGAVLDPIESIEKMEKAFRKLVIASNPAMLWCMLSQLGLSYHIQGYGRLLAEWPKLPRD